MSNIPSSAVSAALTPVQRQSNDSLRARQLQAQKNQHHAEDVQELDDTAVDSIHDEGSGKDGRQQPRRGPRQQLQEKVEIQSVELPGEISNPSPKTEPPPRLDISA